jgi:hypothetical protein
MLDFMKDKVVTVNRKTSTLGEFNRPVYGNIKVGEYDCHISVSSSNTSQKIPQKENTTDLVLYVDADADIRLGDSLYIYEKDEYGNKAESTERKALADKPYKKRTHLAVPLLDVEEV